MKETSVFDNIYLFDNSKIKGLHYFFRTLAEHKKVDNFFKACVCSLKEFSYKVRSKLAGLEYHVSEKIVIGNDIDFKVYDEVFCLDKRKIVVDIVNTVLKDSGSSCKINLLDEGTSTYWRSILDTHFPINDIYLYQPQLANYYNEDQWSKRIKAIPQIDWQDQKFRHTINKIFDFSAEKITESQSDYEMIAFNNKIVFFDQNWDPMPKYFDNLPLMLRLLLYKPYNKHKEEGSFYDAKMQMFRIVADNVFENDVIVKLHPRSPNMFAEDYLKSNCKMAENLKVPWEVFMDNCTFKNNIWVTVSSTALCTYKMAFSNRVEDVPMIFLYKIVYKDKMDFKEDNEFFESFKKRYPESVFLPETVEEFKKIYIQLTKEMCRKKEYTA